MAEHSIIDWGQGTKFRFDQTKPLATHQSSDTQCRPVQKSPEWGRATSFQMLRSNVDSGYAEKARFKRLSNTERLSIAIRRAVNSLPSQAKAKAEELLDPANLAIMAGALAIWIGSQATPVGWVVDIAMAGLGIYALGTEAVVVVRELKAFGMGIIEAELETDLFKAGDHLGKAVAVVGIDLVVALLLKKAIVKVREPVLKGGDGNAAKPLLFGKYDPNKVQTRLPPETVPPKSAPKVPAPKGPSKRPTWRQSELDVGKQYEGQGFEAQKSFKNGVEVPYGTKGSVRPELYKPGTSVEVKNYNVETAAGRASLEKNVVNQAIQRSSELPPGTTQKLSIDVRGQNVSRTQLNEVLTNIETKSGGAISRENISILR